MADAKALQPYIWQNLYDIPEPFRTLGGTILSVEQANWIAQRAYELGWWNKDDENGTVSGEKGATINFVPHWGQARQEFRDTHEVQNGLWITRKAQS